MLEWTHGFYEHKYFLHIQTYTHTQVDKQTDTDVYVYTYLHFLAFTLRGLTGNDTQVAMKSMDISKTTL